MDVVMFSSSHDSSADFVKRYVSKSSDSIQTPTLHSKMEESQLQHFLEEEAFCTSANLEQRLKYMNQEVSSCGFSSILDDQGELHVPHLLNCMHEILQRQAKQRKVQEEGDAKQIRLESDHDYVLQSITRLKDEHESAQRLICKLKLEKKQAQAKGDELQVELKLEREEMKRMKSEMSLKYKQFLHTSRRCEKELNRLKERLHQAISSKLQSNVGLELTRTLQRATSKRGTWGTTTGKGGDEMQRLVQMSHEDRRRELMAENQALRCYLSEVTSKLKSYLSPTITSGHGDSATMTTDSDEENKAPAAKCQKKGEDSLLLSSLLEMPFKLSKTEIDKEFHVLWKALDSRLTGQIGDTPTTATLSTDASKETQKFLSSEIDVLQQQLTEYKDLAGKQETVLKSIYDNDLLNKIEKSLMTDESAASRESFDIKVDLLKQERKNFESERERFTEYALSLCREREAFEKERVEFYRHCISTPVIAKASSSSEPSKGGNKASPSTPRTPLRHLINANDPSTADLYKFMSLASAIKADSSDDNKIESSLNGSYLDGDASPLSSANRYSAAGGGGSRRRDEHINSIRKAHATMQQHVSPQDK